MKTKRFLSLLLALAMMMTVVLSGMTAMAAEGDELDEYDKLLEKWQYMTMGGDYDPEDPNMQGLLKSINDEAQDLLDRMNLNATPGWGANDYLWTEYMLGNRGDAYADSNNTQFSIRNLKNMAIAFQTKGCDLYHDEDLKDAILYGLDYMYKNHFYPGVTSNKYGNWFTWEIGGPIYLCDATALMYDYLDAETIKNYAQIARQGTGNAVDTGANALWRNRVRMFCGILLKDSSLLEYVRDATPAHMSYSTSGDGYHQDGTFIQHTNIVYNGGYGKEALSDISNFVYMLDGSPWEITDSRRENMYTFVRDHYAPFMYNGVFMDMTRGREITRKDTTDAYAGITISLGVLLIANAAPQDVQTEFYGMIKEWMDNDYAMATLNDASGVAWYMYPVYNLSKTLEIINDDSIEKVNNDNTSYTFGYGARTVHVADDFTFGVSMFSPKISTYESGDSNTKGWYTGLGATYTYTNDIGRYTTIKPTFNWYRYPGVTALENTTRGSQTNVSGVINGGTTINDTYSVAGLDVVSSKSDVTAKKSWFMFDNEVVALGTNITSTNASKKAETTIEQYQLKNNNDIIVNGQKMSNDIGWTETVDADWAVIEGNVENSNLGVYFPETTALTINRQNQSGKYTDLGSYNVDETVYTDEYATMYINHGVKPNNDSYAYVLLPTMTENEIDSYSKASDIEILRQDSDVHAVYEKNTNTLGANFWNDGVQTVEAMNSANFLTVDKKSTVMVTESNKSLDVAVSDSSQSNGKITVEINRAADGIKSADPKVQVIQTSPTIIFVVDGNGTVGNPVEVSFSYESLPAPDATTITGAVLDDDALKISYEAAERATGYEVVYGTESGNYTNSVSTTGTFLTLRGLNANTTYYFAVKAINDSGESALSEEYSYSIGNTRTLYEEFEDYSKMISYSGGWAFDAGAPQRFNGDITRLKRNDADKTDVRRAESIVYYTPSPENISLETFEIGGVAEADGTILEVLGSADQVTWTPIEMSYEDGAQTADNWYPRTYTNAGEIDPSYNYIKIVVSNNIKLWAPQLTKLSISYDWTNDRVVTDTMLDDVRTYDADENLSLQTADGTLYGGDTDVRVKTDDKDASVVYSYTNINDVNLTAYLAKESNGAVTILTSKDGNTYTAQEITPVITDANDSYNKAVYAVSGLEDGTNYVKITATGAANSVVLSNLDIDYVHEIAPVEKLRFVDEQIEAVMSYNEAPDIKIAPANAVGEIVYEIANEDVATVNANGVITAVDYGTTKITATVLGTDVSATAPVRTSSNVALGKTVTVSSTKSGYPNTNIVDGNYLTRWESAEGPAQSVQIDLGAATKFQVVDFEWQQYPTEYTVELSLDGAEWDTVYTETNGKGGNVWIDLGEEKEYRYIKIDGTNAVAAYSLWEVRALTFVEPSDDESGDGDFKDLVNVALGKQTKFGDGAQNGNDAQHTADRAVDGDETTRFSSARADGQWWYVDLGAEYEISKFSILWEAAYGKVYNIQVSDDALTWTNVISETNGSAGWKEYDLGEETVTGRYVRMDGVTRGTNYGFSFFEFQVWSYQELTASEVTSISFAKDTVNVIKKQALQLDPITTPADASAASFVWESSDTTVAKVDQYGVVTGVAEGEATIKVSSVFDPEISATCKVVVQDYIGVPVAAQSVTITNKEMIAKSAIIDTEVKLDAVVAPEDALNKNIKWSSSDESIAIVASDGTVKYIGYGEVTITATSVVNAEATDSVTVNVTDEKVNDIPVTVSVEEKAYAANEDITLTITTSSDVMKLGIVNENGKYLSKKSVSYVENAEDGTKTWTVVINIATKGYRTLEVTTMGEDGIMENTGVTFDLNIDVPVVDDTAALTVDSVRILNESAKVNEVFTVTVVTSKAASKVGVYNEAGKALGKVSENFVDKDDTRVWTISLKIGSSGTRTLTFKAADTNGNWTEEGIQSSISIAK